MEPKFEFAGTTNSTQYNVKDKTKNNRVFHIKKIYPNGKETYCEYTTNRVNMNTVADNFLIPGVNLFIVKVKSYQKVIPAETFQLEIFGRIHNRTKMNRSTGISAFS